MRLRKINQNNREEAGKRKKRVMQQGGSLEYITRSAHHRTVEIMLS